MGSRFKTTVLSFLVAMPGWMTPEQRRCAYLDVRCFTGFDRRDKEKKKRMESMEGHGGAWKGIDGHGRAWKGMEGHGRALKGMEGHGKAWKSMEGHGRAWKGMEGHGTAWKGMEGHGRA